MRMFAWRNLLQERELHVRDLLSFDPDQICIRSGSVE